MNIAIDIRAVGKQRTGDEVYTVQLIQGLKRLNTGHTFYLFTDSEDWYQIEILRDLPEEWHVIPLLPKWKLIWTEYLLSQACAKYHIDLLHIQYIAPFFLPKYTKMINTIHDISWKFVPEYIKPKDSLLLNTLIPLSVKKSDAIITVSQHSNYAIQTMFNTSADKVNTIYNGGYISTVPPVINTSAVVREVLTHNYILYLGSLQPRKNIPSAIKAFARYIDDHPESQLKFVIAGGKGYHYDTMIDDTIQQYNLQGKVLFVGFITEDEKIILLRQAQLFIYLSLYEGFGIPLIEAMSMHTPVIAANTSCLPEVVGDAGILVDPHNINQITEAITTLIHNPLIAKQYKDKGDIRAQIFTWDTMVEKTYSLYKKLLLDQ